MSYRRAVLVSIITLFLVPMCWIPTADAQVAWDNLLETDSWSGPYKFTPCEFYPSTYRWIRNYATTVGTTTSSMLFVGINMDTDNPDLMKLPYSVLVTGNPTGQDAPDGIPPFNSGSPCWWYGGPKFLESEAMSNYVTNDPANPVPPGGNAWRVFLIPLTDNTLLNNEGAHFFFNLNHNAKYGIDILEDVNGFVTGLIPAPAAGKSPQADTTIVFSGTDFTYDYSKMHFEQYPDTFGVDVDFTYPNMVLDDWVCTETDAIEEIKFWFSAEGDWFDPVLDLDLIDNIHVGVFANDENNGWPRPMQGVTDLLSLWSADFEADAPNVSIVEYGEGLQGWCIPDSAFVPDDHMKIFQCTITDFDPPFIQEEDSTYWLGLSIATDDSTSPTLRLGWKSADMDRYPPGYAGDNHKGTAHYFVLGDTGSVVEAGIDDFCFAVPPDTGTGIDMAFILDHLIIPLDDPVCGNDQWEPGEFCGVDCYHDIGYTDMTHDCIVDYLDFWEFAKYYAEAGVGLPADFNKDGIVSATDFVIFAINFGLSVSPCSPIGSPQPVCEGTIALSADSNSTVSTTTLPPGPNKVYIIIDDWEDASVLEYGLEVSPNIFILSQTVLQPTSPVTVSCDPSPLQAFRSYAYPSGAWPTGRVVWAEIGILVTDPNPAWMKLTTITGCQSDRIRWAKNSVDRSHDFLHVTNLAINGATLPTTGTTCTTIGIAGGDTPAAHALGQNYPNPFNPSTVIPYQLSETGHVNIAIFNVRGELVRTLVDQQKPEGWYGVNWDGTNTRDERVASGIYFYRMRAGAFTQTKKLVLLK